MSEINKCRKCQTELTNDNWSLSDKKNWAYICKKCKAEYSRNYYQVHKEHYRQTNHEYYLKHKEKYIQQAKKWQLKNPEKRRIIARNSKRRHSICYSNGKELRGNKREYPTDDCCELCGRHKRQRLFYHHWDDDDLMKGLWVCGRCHRGIHFVDSELSSLYQIVRKLLE